MITDDFELLKALKAAAQKANCSPYSLIHLGVGLAEWQRHAVTQAYGPYPHLVDQAEITLESLDAWPEWVATLAPAGSKWERLHWPDGSLTIRLVTPRALVLGAVHLPNGGKHETP